MTKLSDMLNFERVNGDNILVNLGLVRFIKIKNDGNMLIYFDESHSVTVKPQPEWDGNIRTL